MIKITSSDLDKFKKIGEGGFGVVYQVDDNVAYKIYKPVIHNFKGAIVKNPSLLRPMSKYRQIKNKGKNLNYTDLITDCIKIDGKFGGVVIPYYDGVMLSRLREFDFKVKRDITQQLIRNAKELDKNCIYPTDYKLTNMMYVDGEVKLLDLDDTRTHYLRFPNKVYRFSSIRKLNDSIKRFFHESDFRPYSLAVSNRLEKNRWVGLNQSFDDTDDLLLSRDIERDFLIISDSSDLDLVIELLRNNHYSLLYIYEKKILNDEYFMNIIDKMNRLDISIYDFICRCDIDHIYSDYNVHDALQVSGESLVKRKR